VPQLEWIQYYGGPATYFRAPERAPEELPEGWIATSVRYAAGDAPLWHLGMLTDDRLYVGVEQQRKPGIDMVEEFVDEDATRGDDVTVDGATWQSWTDAGDDTALVLQADDVTTLVVGAVPEETLAAFVESAS